MKKQSDIDRDKIRLENVKKDIRDIIRYSELSLQDIQELKLSECIKADMDRIINICHAVKKNMDYILNDYLTFNSFKSLEKHLKNSMMFNENEIENIMALIGSTDIYSVINACRELKIDLTSDDIRELNTIW